MSPLDRVHTVEAEKAREVLAPFRGVPSMTPDVLAGTFKINAYDQYRCIHLGGERADNLEQKICEALVEAYNRGRNSVTHKFVEG